MPSRGNPDEGSGGREEERVAPPHWSGLVDTAKGIVVPDRRS